MTERIGAGWTIHSISDRVVWLTKESALYRDFTGGRDGYVKVRVDPETGRAYAFERAIELAAQNDMLLGLRVAEKLMPQQLEAQRATKYGADRLLIQPRGVREAMPLAKYQETQRQLARLFATDEEDKRYRA